MKTYAPHDLGRQFLVEECQRVSINPFLRSTREKLKEVLLASEIKAAGILVSITTSQSPFGTRYWFKCPLCEQRIGVLSIHPTTNLVGCRKCLGLEYRKRRYKGMVEA